MAKYPRLGGIFKTLPRGTCALCGKPERKGGKPTLQVDVEWGASQSEIAMLKVHQECRNTAGIRLLELLTYPDRFDWEETKNE